MNEGEDSGEDPDVAPEYPRYLRYVQAMADAPEAAEAAAVAAVLAEPDLATSEGAVNRHLECRAAELLTGPGFPRWAEAMGEVVAGRAFLTRRLREWALLRSVVLDEPWAATEITAASDWFQRTAVHVKRVTSPDALGLLAERGRTRKVRNAAVRRLRELGG